MRSGTELSQFLRLFLSIYISEHKGPTNAPCKNLANKLSRFGENVSFYDFAIFSMSGHLEISTNLNYTILKPCSLIICKLRTIGTVF